MKSEQQHAINAIPQDVSGSSREKDEDYRHIVVQLDPSTRIIECVDGIQWIIQRRDGPNSAQPRWRGASYCRTRASLERRLPEHRVALEMFPPRFEEMHGY